LVYFASKAGEEVTYCEISCVWSHLALSIFFQWLYYPGDFYCNVEIMLSHSIMNRGGKLMDNLLETAKAVLSTTATRWSSLTDNLPEELLIRKPLADEWSAMDCLCHLLDTERWIFPERVKALMVGENFVDFDPDTQGTHYTLQDPKQLSEAFAQLRRSSLIELEMVTQKDLSRTAQHSELGTVTLGELLHEWAAHDLMHTVQAERAMLQPLILGSGPWRLYFKDHDVSN
jgi:DinB superfamily